MTAGASTRPIGRPREFDRETALEAALQIFLDRGYPSASVSDLTGAMGINRPSLYACFGSKERLFERALDLHSRRHLADLKDALSEPTTRSFAEKLLTDAMADHRLAGGIGGVMGLLCSMPADPELASVRAGLLLFEEAVTKALGDRFEMAQLQGEVSTDATPNALAFLLEALAYGISAKARDGASVEELDDLRSIALSALEGACGYPEAPQNNMPFPTATGPPRPDQANTD